jgi:hypothetical protein
MNQKHAGPNWGLAFGAGSFLLVNALGLSHDIPVDLIAVRALTATIAGAACGVIFGKTVEAFKEILSQNTKSGGVNFALPEMGPESLDLMLDKPVNIEALVPKDIRNEEQQAEKAADKESVEKGSAKVDTSFQPIDLKSASKHVQGLLSDS